MKTNSKQKPNYNGLMGLFFALLPILSNAQTDYTITGKVIDETGQAVAFANIAIRELRDSSLVGGTISDELGNYTFRHRVPGTYLLSASFVGYESASTVIDATEGVVVDAGTVVLHRERTIFDEVVIRQNRQKAKQQVDRTTYYVNSRMRSASHTATGLMNMVPGVQVDLFNNISLDGSTAIVILVNGMERNADYLARIDVDQIDRVDVKSSGGMRYGSENTGVINVILKNERHSGVSGNVYANVPTKADEVFSFPSASLEYSRGKTTWYTSYNGGFSYFSIKGKNTRIVLPGDRQVEVSRNARIGQENWSHKVHFGLDRSNDEENQFSLYGFLSGFSNEQDGQYETSISGNVSGTSTTLLEKDDTDLNRSAYGSVYYRHRFLPGTDLTLEGSYYLLRSEMGIVLTDHGRGSHLRSQSEPGKDEMNVRVQLNSRISEILTLETGLQQQFNRLQDHLLPSFSYTDRIFAGYLKGAITGKNVQASGGMRVAYSQVNYSDVLNDRRIFVLPQADLKFNINSKSNLKLSYGKRIDRPNIHQLNPHLFALDLYTLQQGNPGLLPEVNRNLTAMYSVSFRENFLSAGLFYRREQGIIEDLVILKDTLTFLREKQNLGDRYYTGMKALGSVNLNERFSINPHFEIYQVRTRVSELARSEGVADRSGWEYKGKISAIWTIKDDLSLSSSVQFQSTTRGIQHEYREGVLYFINLEKVFFDRLKVGITSAVPFMRSFTYQGHAIESDAFKVISEDNITLSMVPVWFKLKYSFASGRNVRRFERDKVFEEHRVKKGF